MSTITLAQLRATVDQLRQHALAPYIVETAAQARYMTAKDPAGHVWAVGDRYFHVQAAPNSNN